MKSALTQPIGFVKLTNVAVVRFKKSGLRFELACYKNKVQDWRDKRETDLSEVLQIGNIFTNVSKGLVANQQEVDNSFPGMTREKIIETILMKGEVQVAELERGTAQESLKKNIANIIAEKTLNSKTYVRFPVSIILKAMDAVHYGVKPGEQAKKQALIAMKKLEEVLPIRRTRIRLSITFPSDGLAQVKKVLEEKKELVEILNESSPSEGQHKVILLVDPNLYRDFTQMMKDAKGVLEVEDQYGELAKGKQAKEEDEGKITAEWNNILEKYEKDAAKKAADEEEETKVKLEKDAGKKIPKSTDTGKKAIVCSTCLNAPFEFAIEYKNHVKGDWHISNLKRKTQGLTPLSLKEYEEKLLDDMLKETATKKAGKGKGGKKKDQE